MFSLTELGCRGEKTLIGAMLSKHLGTTDVRNSHQLSKEQQTAVFL